MGRDRAVVDDAATLWALLLHQLEGIRQGVERAVEVDVDSPAPFVARQIARQGVGQRDAGVVEHQIEATKAGANLLEQGFDFGLFGQVGRDGVCVASVGTRFSHGSGQRIGAAADQNHLPAFFEQGEGAGFADAGAGTGDEGYF